MSNSSTRSITVINPFDAEEQRRQLERTIAYWQEAGPTAIWDATFEILDFWFEVRGIDPESQRIDRTAVTVRPLPTRSSTRRSRRGRSTAKGLHELFEEFLALDVRFLSLRDSLDLSTPAGRLMAGVLASVAQYETEVRRERQLAGIAKVREQHGGRCPWGGRKHGTRVKITEEKEGMILAMYKEKRRVASIARTVGVTRKTVYAVLLRHRE